MIFVSSFGFLYFQIQVTEKYSTAMCHLPSLSTVAIFIVTFEEESESEITQERKRKSMIGHLPSLSTVARPIPQAAR